MALYHAYTQTVADGTATSVVRPSDWNSGHVHAVTLSGNTSGVSTVSGTNIVYQGGNNVTLSAAQGAGVATVVVSVANLTTANVATSQSSLFQHTSATSAITSNAFPSANTTKFAGTGTSATNASITLNSNGLAISVAAGGGGGGATAVRLEGNTVGNSSIGLDGNSAIHLYGGNNITLSGNGSTVVISAAAGGGGGAGSRSYIEINQGERFTTVRNMSETVFSNRPQFFPFWVEGMGIVPKTCRFFVSGAASSNRSLGATIQVGLYSLVNSSQMTLLASDSMSFSYTASSQSSIWNGPAYMDFTGMSNFTQTAEGRYALAMNIMPVSANATWANVPIYGCDPYPSLFKVFVAGTTSATNSTNQLMPWQGVYSTTTNAMPVSIAKSQVYGGNSASAHQPYAILMGY